MWDHIVVENVHDIEQAHPRHEIAPFGGSRTAFSSGSRSPDCGELVSSAQKKRLAWRAIWGNELVTKCELCTWRFVLVWRRENHNVHS